MKNFQPGGLRGRKPDLGGRPQSDVNSYAPKFRSSNDRNDSKPRFTDRNDKSERFTKKDVTLFSATCTTCGKACEVPFLPDGTKPVLCRDCFATKNASPTNMTTGRDRFTPNELVGHKPARVYEVKNETAAASKQYDLLLKQLAVVETKVSQILELINVSEKLIIALPLVSQKEEIIEGGISEAAKMIRKPKKVAVKKSAKKVPAKTKKAIKKST